MRAMTAGEQVSASCHSDHETLAEGTERQAPGICCKFWQDLPLQAGQAPGRDGLKNLLATSLRHFPILKSWCTRSSDREDAPVFVRTLAAPIVEKTSEFLLLVIA